MKEETKQKISEANKKRHAEKKAAEVKEVKAEIKETPKVEVVEAERVRIFKTNFAFKYVAGQPVPSSLMPRIKELEKRGVV